MKKTELNNAKLAMLAYGAAMALASTQVTAGSGSCTAGTVAAGVICNVATTDAPISQGVSITGSNEVQMTYSGDTTGFGACARHIRGTAAYGSTLSGGSGSVRTGTAASPRTNIAPSITEGCTT